jgi:diguanylate cyclase (GGDEF)-like protein/PAS domain S-box-containing protein
LSEFGIVTASGLAGYSSCFVNHTEQLFESIVLTMEEGVLVHNHNGEIVAINPAAEKILGLDSHEILGQTCEARTRACKIINEDGAEFPAYLHPSMVTLRTGVPQRNVVMGLTKPDNGLVWISINSQSLISKDERQPDGVVTTFRDITDRKSVESDLMIAAAAFDAHVGILVSSADGVILSVNRAFTEITGYSSQEIQGQNPRILKSGRHDAEFYKRMWGEIHCYGTWQGEVWDKRKSGEIYPKWLTIKALKGKAGIVTHYVATQSDISDRKAAENVIENLAYYDPLTQLPNRRLLRDRLQQSIAANQRYGQSGAVMFVDLDNFKQINDTRGHDAGDALLQEVARRLVSTVRNGDTVARLGGDEFVLVLQELSPDLFEAVAQADAVGHKVLEALNAPHHINEIIHYCTPSVGIAMFQGNVHKIDEIFRQADIAMYQAKKAGKNGLRFFNEQMQESIDKRTKLEHELRQALELKQFTLHYQMQIDSSSKPFGAEALIRWAHPERGMVFPADFIPMVEEIGLICPMGEWVLETACQQLRAWEDNAVTKDLVLSVNVSAKQFHEDCFVTQVKSIVQRYAINPALLKLELTESMLIENIECTIATMIELKDIGVEISLDDFGTGYSSLQYLKRLPLNQLKIDKSFVRDVETDSNDRAIVRTIIAMAKGLKLSVIAEGVESEAQRQFLMENGCYHYQGYLFGKPMPIDQFENALKAC